MEFVISLRSYLKSRRISEVKTVIPLDELNGKPFAGDGFQAALSCTHSEGKTVGELTVTFTKPVALPSSVALSVSLEAWKRENYVFAPAAVYNGNRFRVQQIAYPPYAQILLEEAVSAPPVVTDILKLSVTEPVSKIELRSGDMSTPCVGFYDGGTGNGFLLLTKHMAGSDYTGLAVRENLEESTAEFEISAPAVREGTKYFFGERLDGSGFFPDAHAPSDDMGRCFRAGDAVTLSFCVCQFHAETLSDFFGYFNRVRGVLESTEQRDSIPFFKAYHTVKEKYRRENFIQEGEQGYFAVGVRRDWPQQCWQAGWTGGGINNYAFMLEDNGAAREWAVSTFRFVFDKLQFENGWVCGMYGNGVFYGDTFDLSKPGFSLLIRKDADLLYFALKQYLAEPECLASYAGHLKALAGAFVRLFRKYGQIGQFIDTQSETMLIGNSTCGAVACAALALAYDVFGEPSYLETAEALGDLYYREYLEKGYTNGGPGEICQAPDSESAFGLLEGYVQLYETTGKECWLSRAKQAFELAVTWVMNYDFTFPAESAAAKLEAQTVGTVFANAQNKHSAPGICTLSGNSLLKLYRFTHDQKYLQWLRRIAGALTQFVSLPERPVFTLDQVYLPSGYMNERVQTSDWEGKETIGGFLNGSNWPEVCVLLTYAEVPSVYIDFASGTVFALDRVQCETLSVSEQQIRVEIANDSPYNTVVTILCDDSRDRRGVTHNDFRRMHKREILAGKRMQETFSVD